MRRMSWKSGNLNLLKTPGPHRACYGNPLSFTCFFRWEKLLEQKQPSPRVNPLPLPHSPPNPKPFFIQLSSLALDVCTEIICGILIGRLRYWLLVSRKVMTVWHTASAGVWDALSVGLVFMTGFRLQPTDRELYYQLHSLIWHPSEWSGKDQTAKSLYWRVQVRSSK